MNQFTYTHLILETKFGDDPLKSSTPEFQKLFPTPLPISHFQEECLFLRFINFKVFFITFSYANAFVNDFRTLPLMARLSLEGINLFKAYIPFQ